MVHYIRCSTGGERTSRTLWLPKSQSHENRVLSIPRSLPCLNKWRAGYGVPVGLLGTGKVTSVSMADATSLAGSSRYPSDVNRASGDRTNPHSSPCSLNRGPSPNASDTVAPTKTEGLTPAL